MSDSRILRMDELKRLKLDAMSRIEQLSAWRRIVEAGSIVQGETTKNDSERLWLLQVIDNRRALMLSKIEQYDKGIEIAYENAQPELGALFIDGRKI